MNISSVIQTIDLFKPEDALIEVRCFYPKTKSGYFRDKENLIKHLRRHSDDTWYFVMNTINSACYSREQNEKILLSNKGTKTTSANDILRNDWFLVDVDPKRTTGTSATDEEKEKSKEVITKVYKFLHNFGFSKPVTADSGNGYHLLYKIDCQTEEGNTEVLKGCLKALDMMFSTSDAEIDTTVFDPSRITKLYGTIAKKGASTKERPHRESRIVKVPTEIQTTSIQLMKRLADTVPKPETKPKHHQYAGTDVFNIDDFIRKHGIQVSSDTVYGDGRRLILDHCIFDSQHKGKDAAIFVLNNGAIGYKCFHNSCSDKTWQDVRTFFDPSAYDRREELQPRTTKKVADSYTPTVGGNPEFQTMGEISNTDRSKIVTVKTGFEGLDKSIIGFHKGELSVWSGSNGSGKSSVVSQLAIEAVDRGFTVAMFSGELTSSRVKNWMQLQSAGRRNTSISADGISYWVKTSTAQKIDKWFSDKLWLYNNLNGLDVDTVLSRFDKHFEAHKCDVMIVDNLMSFDTAGRGGDKYEGQTEIVKKLKDIAEKHNVHIHFICHPKKTQLFTRKEDISGTADITNIADNVLMIHRVNKDFSKRAKDFIDPVAVREYEKYSNLIEIMKNRDLGVSDFFVGLFFEPESKRFLNYKNENKVFGWEKIGKTEEEEFDFL